MEATTVTGNPPVKCAFCGTKFKTPVAISAGGTGNGIAWVCDEECRELWREERERRKADRRMPTHRAGRDPEKADHDYHGGSRP